MQVAQKAARFNNLLLAVRAIAKSPLDVTADLAASIDDGELKAMERTVEKLVPRMNGSGAEVASWLHPLETPTLAPEEGTRLVAKVDSKTNAHVETRTLPKPKWVKTGEGDKHVVFNAKWQGMALRIEKLRAARYEGFIDDESLGSFKFKKSARERVEQEATKRALLATA